MTNSVFLVEYDDCGDMVPYAAFPTRELAQEYISQLTTQDSSLLPNDLFIAEIEYLSQLPKYLTYQVEIEHYHSGKVEIYRTRIVPSYRKEDIFLEWSSADLNFYFVITKALNPVQAEGLALKQLKDYLPKEKSS